jgi:hypothetical protein
MSTKPKTKGRKKPAPRSSPPSTSEKILPGLLFWSAASVALIALLSRIFLSAIPMTRDEGAYGYLGKLAVKGFTPYVDFYEMKPPLLFYLYGLGGSLFGFTDSGLRLFGLVLNLASCILIFFILSRYIQKHYAMVSAALFTMLSINPFAFGFTMVAEHIVNTFLLLSIFLAHKSYDLKGFKFLLMGGAAFSIAILTKQSAVVFAPLFLLFFILERNKQPWIRQTIWFAAGALIPAILVLLYFMLTESLDEAMYWLIKYPAQYSSTVGFEKGMGFLNFFFKKITGFQITLFVIAAFAIVGNLIYIIRKPNSWLILYFLLALISILPGLRFYGQYWLLMFVPLAMMTGTALNQLDLKRNTVATFCGLLIVVSILFETVSRKGFYFFKGHSTHIDQLFVNNPFEAVRKLSEYAGTLMKDNDTFMMLGSEPQAYLYAEKLAPTRHVFMSMISNTDNKSQLLMDEALNDLKNSKPSYILSNMFPYSWGLGEKSDDHLYQSSYSYVVRNYTPVASFNMSTNKYLYSSNGDHIDPTVAQQVILFKKL